MNQKQAKIESLGLAQAQRKSRVLLYRPHIKFLYRVSLILGVLGLFATGLMEATHFYNQDAILFGWATIIGFVIPISIIMMGKVFLRPLITTRFVVDSDQMVIKRADSETTIRYSEIEKISFSFLHFIGGWAKLHLRDKTSVWLTVAVERSEHILDLILTTRPQLADADKYELYRRTAIFYDHSWARLTALVSNRKKLFIKYVLSAVLFSIAFFYLRMRNFNEPPPTLTSFAYASILALSYGLFVGGLIWMISELAVLAPTSRRKLKDAPESVVRPIEFERQVEVLADLAYFLAMGMTMAFLV